MEAAGAAEMSAGAVFPINFHFPYRLAFMIGGSKA